MNLSELDFSRIFDVFMLLLIGMGPKIAMVPFLDLTRDLAPAQKRQGCQQMVRTAVSVALVLIVLGAFLMRLLHLTPGAASIAGGIVLLLLALPMVVNPGKEEHPQKPENADPLRLAAYPLAVPYLLNPAGIAGLV